MTAAQTLGVTAPAQKVDQGISWLKQETHRRLPSGVLNLHCVLFDVNGSDWPCAQEDHVSFTYCAAIYSPETPSFWMGAFNGIPGRTVQEHKVSRI